MHSEMTGHELINYIDNIPFMQVCLGIVKKRERSTAGEQEEEDSKLRRKVVYSTLPESVCLPEQRSPTTY